MTKSKKKFNAIRLLTVKYFNFVLGVATFGGFKEIVINIICIGKFKVLM